ncbi:MAG: Dyp-type peroxidase [Burkholderiaceae bacterium]
MITPPPANSPDTILQKVSTPMTRAAIFLVLTINSGEADATAIKSLCADLSGLVRSVGFRDPDAGLTCVMGFGSAAWDRLFGGERPAELHPFREIVAETRHAVATPGDLLFHFRSDRMDLCFELETLILDRIGAGVGVAEEVQGFQYFDNRDLLGFVDGTENPADREAIDAILVGAEDPAFAGGSYVITQKYLHDLKGWNTLPTEVQEKIIGRTKLANVELDAETKPTYAHSALTVIVENGEEQKILRENRPFGAPGQGEFGTYFIGYCRTPRTIEKMLENMFVGRPPGNYDRLLDFSKAVSGSLFFVPTGSFLDDVTVGEPASTAAPTDPRAELASPAREGSLGIGSLKGNRL